MPALQLFSMTKFITTVSRPGTLAPAELHRSDHRQVVCQQLADEDILSLDDPDVVEKYCPELAMIPILERIDEDGKEITRQNENRITLWMPLAHAAGLIIPLRSTKGGDPCRLCRLRI